MSFRNRLIRFYKNDTGAILVMIACLLGLFLVILAIVADAGMAYQERRQLQTAVDSAALAAAQDLAEGRGQDVADATAWQYVQTNTMVDADLIEVIFNENSVEVISRTTRSIVLAKLLGRPDVQVEAKARARFGPATSVSNLVPILVPEQYVSSHIGEENTLAYELGNDRPLDPFRKEHQPNGSLIRYIITYINDSSSSVSLKIEDPLPSELTYVDGSATAGGEFNQSENTISWYFEQVLPGDTIIVSFDVNYLDKLPANTAYAYLNGSSQSITARDNGQTAQKGFFWLCDFDAGSGGTPDYEEWIINGYPEEVAIGMIANGEGMKMALKAALAIRKEKDASVVLPLYDYTTGGGSPGQYNVVGFAEFIITGFDFQGNPKIISGYFTDGTITSGAGGDTIPDDYHGVDVVWLDR